MSAVVLVTATVGIKFMSATHAAALPSPQAPDSAAAEAQEWQILALINTERTSRGLPALKMQVELRDYARYHAKEMRTQQDIWHDMTTFATWLPAGYRAYGENVAYNSTVSAVHAAFMNSQGHRDNILKPEFNYIGIGVATGSSGRLYVSEDFMQHSGSPTVVNEPSGKPGDTNDDGRVNAVDLSMVLSNDGKAVAKADFNHDGTVGAADLAILLGNWTW